MCILDRGRLRSVGLLERSADYWTRSDSSRLNGDTETGFPLGPFAANRCVSPTARVSSSSPMGGNETFTVLRITSRSLCYLKRILFEPLNVGITERGRQGLDPA